MKKIILLFGNFTFHHFDERELGLFKQNTEQKALIHSIDKVFECKTTEEAYKLVDKLEGDYESWLVPSDFRGEIVIELGDKKEELSENAELVYNTLIKKYLKSDVVSGEFYDKVKFSVEISENDMRNGIQKFLEWDESEAVFVLKANKKFWKIIDI